MKLQRWTLYLISVGLLYLLPGTDQFVRWPSRAESPTQMALLLPKTAVVSAVPRSQAEVYRLVNPAVVTIYSGNEIGAGSVINSNGWILTNKHVVEPSLIVTVKTADGETYSGQVLDIDLRHDLALVQLDQFVALPAISFAPHANLHPGTTVYAIGSPAGRSNTITQGTFNDLTPAGSLRTSRGLLQAGNSGGPLLNAQGEMVGVNKGVMADNRGLATPISAVRMFLSRVLASRQPEIAPQTAASGSAIAPPKQSIPTDQSRHND